MLKKIKGTSKYFIKNVIKKNIALYLSVIPGHYCTVKAHLRLADLCIHYFSYLEVHLSNLITNF